MSITKRVLLAGAGLAAMTGAAVAEIEIRAVKNGQCLSTIFSANNHTNQVLNIGGRSVRVQVNPAVAQPAPQQIFQGLSQVATFMVGKGAADASAIKMENCTGSWAGFCGTGRIHRVGSRAGDLFAIASCPRVSGGWSNNGPENMFNQLMQSSGARAQPAAPARPERQPVRSAPVGGTPVAPSAPASTGGWFSAPAAAASVETRPAPRTETRTGGSTTVRACRDRNGCLSFDLQVR